MTSSSRAVRAHADFVLDASFAVAGDFQATAETLQRTQPVPAPAPPQTPDLEVQIQQAYERGVEAGRAELPWREAERLEAAAAALREALEGVEERALARRRFDREALIELALAVARRILGCQLSADLDALVPLLDQAMEALPQREEISIQLSPRDMETLRAGRAPALERLRDECAARLVPDPELAPGAARIVAGASLVDARPDQVLERFRRELRELLDVEEGPE